MHLSLNGCGLVTLAEYSSPRYFSCIPCKNFPRTWSSIPLTYVRYLLKSRVGFTQQLRIYSPSRPYIFPADRLMLPYTGSSYITG
ncbi:unknown protein [Desulfotalea psychrophila LSv54]|uniref:Uncharacterized protein n=1 Tax=Desulfotalea psychrophila (strain LSv54 / DSM 12343) TaxID=177439 RepID=Q6ALG7_DESPS|nr:unknown protein [Desulfotalea psychrophila LSv54]